MPSSKHEKDRYSMVWNQTQWLWATCDWVFLRAIPGEAVAANHSSNCTVVVFFGITMCIVTKESQVVVSLLCWREGTPWHCHDFHVWYMTILQTGHVSNSVYLCTAVPCCGPCFTTVRHEWYYTVSQKRMFHLWLAIVFTYTARLQQFLAKMLPRK